MAAHTPKEEVRALAVSAYEDVRPGLRTGNLLFASGNYRISKLIQTGTGSPWSHVGMIVVAETIGRVLLLESVETFGVRLAPLSKYLIDYEVGKPYDGEVIIAVFDGAVDVLAAVSAGIDELTRPYNGDEYADLVLRIATQTPRTAVAAEHTYVCSELVQYCWGKGGYVFHNNPLGFFAPEDAWIDPGTRFLARVL